jgi:hypothetical protein
LREEVATMTKKAERVELDTDTWDRLEAAGSRSGQSRDEFIDRAVRRALGGSVLDAIFQRVRERSDITSDRRRGDGGPPRW